MTLPQQPLPVSVFDPAAAASIHPVTSGALICDPVEIFDATEVRRQIDQIDRQDKDNAAMRAEVVRILRAVQKDGRATIAARFWPK